ncbi:MAG: phosphoribosylformylglycinamidine synthase subunit PurS [Conexivisphaera sp.]
MALHRVRVEVWLREELVDPEGRTIRDALSGLGFPVSSVRAGRIYDIIVEAGTAEEAASIAREMCDALLANPVRDACRAEVVGDGDRGGRGTDGSCGRGV